MFITLHYESWRQTVEGGGLGVGGVVMSQTSKRRIATQTETR
jgi:hypothetical protein